MILYDGMGNGVEADGCGVLPGIAPKNGLSKIIKPFVQPVSLSSQVWSVLTTTLLRIGNTDVLLSGTHQLRTAGSHLSEFRSGCNRCILLRIWKSRDTKKLVQHVNGSLSASLFTYIPFLFFFSVLHFLFICLFVCGVSRKTYGSRSENEFSWQIIRVFLGCST